MRYAALALGLCAIMFSGCQPKSNLADRIKAAGGVDALKADCRKLVAEYEASGLKSLSFSLRTNHPPTIAALAPKNIQVGRQDNVVLVHMSFVIGPHPHGIYVAPNGCPAGFEPRRPVSSVSKIADGVFEYAE
jgi:hypothetical protein